MGVLLKLSQNKKDLNDVTAALFLVGFFAAGSCDVIKVLLIS